MSELILFLGAPFAACMVMGVMLSYLGMHVLKREVIFIDISIAQTVALGALAAHLFYHVEGGSFQTYLCSLVCVVFMALFYAVVRGKIIQIPIECVIGVTYALTAAAAMLLIGFAPHEMHAEEMLAGSLLWVTWDNLFLSTGVFAVVSVFLFLFRKPLREVTEHYQEKHEYGLITIFWDFVFYCLFGVVITFAVPITGVVVAFTLLIVPSTTSVLFTARTGLRLLINTALVAAASTTGLLFSYHYDFSVGPSVAIFLGILLVAAVPLAEGLRAVSPARRARQG